MKVIIDRFEGDYAVCEKEDRTTINIEKKRLPRGAKEGDALIVEGDLVNIDHSDATKRKNEVKKLMDELWK